MRFWITKNSELPVHEQLVRQVMLAVLSEELRAGQRMPSVRAVARRYEIHANTVSAAYQDLARRGWLESRKGSGMYVRAMAAAERRGDLDGLLAGLLEAARGQGFEAREVLQRLEQLLAPGRHGRVLVAEPEAGMREILCAELAGAVADDGGEGLVVALPTRAAILRAAGRDVTALRVRSVRESLEGERRPEGPVVVSRSAEFRRWARMMLIAVGIEPDSLSEIDTAEPGWQQRALAGGLVVTDVVAGSALRGDERVRVFRVIADASVAEIGAMGSGDVTAAKVS